MIFLSLTLILLILASAVASADDGSSGYSIGNFGIAAEVRPDGGVLSHILYNPSELGPWLEEMGNGEFAVQVDGLEIRDRDFSKREVDRLFPESSVVFSDDRIAGIEIKASFISPIGVGDVFTSSLPAILADFAVTNTSDEEKIVELVFLLRPGLALEDTHLLQVGSFWLVGTDTLALGFDRAISWQGTSGRTQVACRLVIPSGTQKTARFAVIRYGKNGFYADELVSMQQLAQRLFDRWETYYGRRKEFIDSLPRTGDRDIDRYLRWYVSAGVLLTRVTRNEALTMGYAELNQRDSYWTSWIHLVLWPELERKMIEESAQFQREDGKIPTTILPVIERDDDIDINEYFILRVIRYYEWTHDLKFVRKIWPNVKRAVGFLRSRDKDGDHLLDQGSFWGDWKDVSGVEGRKAAPHFEFLWLAALDGSKKLAGDLGDRAAEEEYGGLLEEASRAVNRDVKDGGLWTGSFYTTLWYDCRKDDHVQEDQVVGPLYGVVPPDRVRKVFDALKPNLSEWGYRDTFPYRENFSHEPGDYHNGGVWVFLNFVDALARFKCGYPKEGEEILRRVGHWDLEKWGDFMPHEYLDGNTGASAGKPVQGWDAAYYGAVVFGLLGVKMIGPDRVEIMPRIPANRSFSTPIILPKRRLTLSQTAHDGRTEVTVKLETGRALDLTYGVMTDKEIAGSTPLEIGECRFRVVKKRLEAGRDVVISNQ